MSDYAIIYFPNGKTKKKKYDTATKAVYDYPECSHAELYNNSGIKLSSFKNLSQKS